MRYSSLWHVTAASNLPSLEKHGLSPAEAGRWIYLASDETHARGYEAFFPGQEVILLQIKTKFLDKDLLGPDDQDLPNILEDTDPDDDWENYSWKESLTISGQATYDGTIPWKAIKVIDRWDSSVPAWRWNPISESRALGMLRHYLFGEGHEATAAGGVGIKLLNKATAEELRSILSQLDLTKPDAIDRLKSLLHQLDQPFAFDDFYKQRRVYHPGEILDDIEIPSYYWGALSDDELAAFLSFGTLPLPMELASGPNEAYDLLRQGRPYLIRLKFLGGTVTTSNGCPGYDLRLDPEGDADVICTPGAVQMDYLTTFQTLFDAQALSAMEQIADKSWTDPGVFEDLLTQAVSADLHIENSPGAIFCDLVEANDSPEISSAAAQEILDYHGAYPYHLKKLKEAEEGVAEIASGRVSFYDEDWVVRVLAAKYVWLDIPGPSSDYWDTLDFCRDILRTKISPFILTEDAQLPGILLRKDGKPYGVLIGIYPDDVVRQASILAPSGVEIGAVRQLQINQSVPPHLREAALASLSNDGMWSYFKF